MKNKKENLTPSQLKVAKAILEFELIDDIALDLKISRNTVRVHISAVLRKIGYKTRFAMVKDQALLRKTLS